MTRSIHAVLTAGCFAIALFAISCKKDAQLSPAAETLAPPKGGKEFKKCDLAQIISRNIFGDENIITFEYNKKGDPVSVTPSFIGTGTPQWLFRYDNKGRVTDFIGVYENGGFEFWHKYGYDKHNRIIVDTQYIFGLYGDEPMNYNQVFYIQYSYDAQGRISQMVHSISGVTNYTYDANGNLVRPGAVYDTQVNFRRTNQMWMFITRDYSMNNPVAADAYNSEGLPTEYDITPPPFYSFFSWSLIDASLSYNCKGNSN